MSIPAHQFFTNPEAIRRKVLGETSPETLLTLGNLGMLYLTQGRLDDAEPLLAEAYARHRAVTRGDHTDVLTAANNLASLHKARGRYEEAEALYREVLAGRRRMHPAARIQATS